MTVATAARLRRMGEVLLEQGLVTPAQIDRALRAQKGSPVRKLLGEVLVELGYCTELQILEALAAGYQIPFVRLTPQLIDSAVATRLPREYLVQHAVLPLFLVDGVMSVTLAEPSDVFLIEELAAKTGFQIQCVASPRSDILAGIEAAFRARSTDTKVIDEILAEAEEAGEIAAGGRSAVPDVSSENDSPVVKLVQQLITAAVREGASDIHVEPGEKELRIRFRVDGRLYEKMKPPHQMTAALVSRVKILSSLDIAERRLPQDGAIRMVIDDRPIDLRVSTLPHAFGEKVVMRILDAQNAVVPLDKLGMEPSLREALEQEVNKPHGLILVTGPTGSGKSTTLYSAMSAIVNPEINICTVEDPVEYHIKGINQFLVRESIGLSFAASLRSLLRQDPDVIMVGEIRDAETARIAVQAALTGHLVLSTLHTNDAPGSVSRLQNLGVEPFLISSALESVLAQRLVRKICTNCKTEVEAPPHLRRALEQIGIKAERVAIGRGCSTCHQMGGRGRLGIFEFFKMGESLRNAITSGATTDRLREIAVAEGMVTLRQDGLAKAKAGIVAYEDVLKATAA